MIGALSGRVTKRTDLCYKHTMSTPVPVWKRVVGGLFGVGLLAGIVLLLKGQETSGEAFQVWQERIVLGAAATFAVVLFIQRRKE